MRKIKAPPYDKWSLSLRHGASSGCGWRNGLQYVRVAANILNKQSRTADEGWPSSLILGDVLTSHLKIGLSTKRIHLSLVWTDPLVETKEWKRDMRFGK
jgi:hypothetical protein